MTKLSEQEWLNLVKVAAEVYTQDSLDPNEVTKFVKWLFSQYGYVYNKE